jgi:hypothetical protein
MLGAIYRPACGMIAAFYPVDTVSLSLRVKHTEPEADHLCPFNAEIENEWNYSSSF